MFSFFSSWFFILFVGSNYCWCKSIWHCSLITNSSFLCPFTSITAANTLKYGKDSILTRTFYKLILVNDSSAKPPIYYLSSRSSLSNFISFYAWISDNTSFVQWMSILEETIFWWMKIFTFERNWNKIACKAFQFEREYFRSFLVNLGHFWSFWGYSEFIVGSF